MPKTTCFWAAPSTQPFFSETHAWPTHECCRRRFTLSGEWEAEDGLAWSPDGREIWFTATQAGTDRTLFAVARSGKLRRVLSVPASLRLYDIYSDGRVLLSAGHERVGWTIAGDISKDGKRVLFDEQSEFGGANYTVAMRTIDGSPPVKLGNGFVAHFSPDEKWIATVIPSQANHFSLLPTGAGQPTDVAVSGLERLFDVALMSNGDLLLVGSERGHGIRCYSRSMEGGPLRALTSEESNNCRCSPDSRYVVAREASGPLSIYSLQDGKSHPVPGTEGMTPIRWSDNRFFFTYRQGELPGRLYRVDGFSGNQTLIKELVPGDRAGVTQIQIVAASPDGSSLSYSYQQALYELYVVEGLR